MGADGQRSVAASNEDVVQASSTSPHAAELSALPRRAYDAEHRIESARLYGDVQNYQYYFVDMLVGTPSPQRTSVIADTGSSLCAFTCSGCSKCGDHLDANFDFSRSSTAQWLPCGSGCASCSSGRCNYRQSYTEGSSIEGSWFTDYASLGDEFQRNPPVKVSMGCHKRETRLFFSQKANGILGLGPGSGSRATRTILQDLYKDQDHVNTALFAMCLATDGGLLTVGGYNSSAHVEGASVKWLPMQAHGFYTVSLTSVLIEGNGGSELTGPFGRCIVDSGTTFTYFPDATYRSLKQKISSFCDANSQCGASSAGSCWRVQGGKLAFPSLKFRLGGIDGYWHPRSYLYKKSRDLYCYGFESNGHVTETVLGATWMIHRNVIFDVESSQLGIADADCPAFRERPLPPGGNVIVGAISAGVSANAGKVGFLGGSVGLALLVICGLGSVTRHLYHARKPDSRVFASPTASRRGKARRLGRQSPAAEEAPGLVIESDEEAVNASPVAGVPLEKWLQVNAGDGDTAGSATPGSGSDSAPGNDVRVLSDMPSLL
eukprot:TRINITY_DN29262_c0_g1_i1.p1 TRINITY_DN29262_c0_g1~~TRINITY_DN29262_c0_g1_i1.p1  ORF type:complete len:547 (+),score=82.85 TRINITY_DN29262_c0_g1_i1:70-1710(+)